MRLLVGNRARDLKSDYTDLGDDCAKQYEWCRQVIEIGPETLQQFNDLLHNAAELLGREVGWIDAFANFRSVRLFRTKSGHLGLVPLSAEVADVVRIFHGSCVLFVLRPCKDTKGAFRLVSKCFIHGTME